MSYCSNCGNEMGFNQDVCLNCGHMNNKHNHNNVAVNDPGGFTYFLLGFCVPIAGLILFFVWKPDKPKTAKIAGIGALVSTILTVILYIIYFVFIIMVANGSIGPGVNPGPYF